MRNDKDVNLPVMCFLGPTASGKSGLAVRVCLRLARDGHPAEIINTDSMVVYRGMDIGTATPTVSEQRAVKHHLVSILDVTEPSSIVLIQTLARAATEDCLSRGVIPVLVGGSALYTKAIIDEMTVPPTDPKVRAKWQERLNTEGPEALHEELARRDPKAATSILPRNGRRIVRALEVVELTGSFTATIPDGTFHWPNTVQIGLELPREDMDRRIADRVDQMWQEGLVDEVRALADDGLRDGLTASRALGYRQVLEFLDGEYDEDEARRRTVSGTRRFARKQLMWYRRDDRIEWFNALDSDLDDKVVARVLTALSADKED
ncbi:tRNA (adenosine(37)-N6)-dimethylallyltransferase MiaA [Cutibacterium sp.]|uniref:tRNA (adenosine(37)-N6)-dimethylallyltransferase MiaA n=1 Tax=Cutibacterium sp. TaxID=1912221 RepID=UPI0026DCCC8E|nr:tRNA (adenosine(37)-N6)-dimethylallyltransferase MiaA [Cutibacterium sp.]MDO4411834.1 tRNA (adenosine(37)-N6)-dimethylallyltransferase MiaA [Cutibacterium sp.]